MEQKIKKSETANETLLRNWGWTGAAIFLLILMALVPSILSMAIGG